MKIIKTATDHAAAVEELETLMIADPPPGSEGSEKIELLGFLIETYEKKHHPIPPPHPVEAIRFAMEQQELKQVDLVPYLGSKSRVSEVLSGKRELTLAMVRKLHEGLGIPIKSLIGETSEELPPRIDPGRYPVKEMFIRGFFAAAFGTDWSKVKEKAEEMLQSFFRGRENDPLGAFNRQTTTKKSKVDTSAVHAWRCRILDQASTLNLPPYDAKALDADFIKDLTKLSRFPTGPVLAQQALHEVGIAMIVEPHLTGTYLDGAAIWHPDGFPVIALTIRHDRLDNFWFTLFHELGHVKLHLKADADDGFIDTDIDGASEKEIERQADGFSLNAFVREQEWDQLSSLNHADEIKAAAKKLAIHPAIIAGRLRREANDYRKHRTLIGQGKVKELFDLP